MNHQNSKSWTKFVQLKLTLITRQLKWFQIKRGKKEIIKIN